MLMDNEKRLSDDYAALESERDRLREAVKEIANDCKTSDTCDGCQFGAEDCRLIQIARKALKEE
jgi:hypothetical protein